MKCDKCGGLYLYPYISEKELSLMYGAAYFTGKNSDSKDWKIPASEEDFDAAYSANRKQKFIETVVELKSMKPTARTILDIGAATGDFLAIARDYDLEVEGIELSNYAAEMAMRKYGMFLHKMNVLDYSSDRGFDLIHMNHVFEHFPSPRLVAEKLYELTNIGGLVYIEVPFQFNIVELLKYKFSKWRQPFNVFSVHHPVFYRPKTLIRLMADHGFECVQIRLFRFSRYPTNSFMKYMKGVFWMFATLFGQGTQIETVFRRVK